MIQKNTIIACIDGSSSARAVCLSSSWLAQKLSYALTFVHVVALEQIIYPHDLSGSIGYLRFEYTKYYTQTYGIPETSLQKRRYEA